MRRLFRIGALCVLVGACSKGADGPPLDAGVAEPAPAAHLETTKGEVTLDRGGKVGPAQLGYLFVGDAIETGEGGEATVRFPGGRRVEVGPDARFTIAEGEGGLVLNVARGLVLTRVPAAKAGEKLEPQVSLSILTPFGLTRVGKSEVAVDVGADTTRVDVKIGQIELVSRNGEVTTAGAGEKVEQGTKKVMVLPAVEVTIFAGGKSELKKKDGKSWVAMGKKPMALADGDAMRVKDGKATLQAGTTKLVFGKGTEVGFAKALGDETDLDLKKGDVAGTLTKKGKVRLGGGLTLVSDLGGQFTVTRTGSGFDVSAVAGDLRIERPNEEAKVLQGGQSAKVGKAVEVTEASRDVLALPTRMGLKVFHPNVGRMSLVWDGDEGKAYRVEVAPGPSFTEPLVAGVLHQRFVSVAVPARGNLYWRVFDAEKEVDRGSAYFAPEPRSAGELDLRRNEVQDGADKTTIYYQDKPPALTFTFAGDPGAAKYKLSVFKEGALSVPVLEKSVKETQVVLDGALAEGKYLWSVTPLDAKNAGLRGGKLNKLDIVYDNAVPTLLIKSPRNGDAGGGAVLGVAPVGAKVFVNGRALELDDKSRFNTKVAALPGGRFFFRVVGKNGAEVYTVRTVRR